MAKIKFTKNELKKQKDELKRFQRYLPTLTLKKQLLQMEIRQIEIKIEQKQAELEKLRQDLLNWIAVFGEEIDLEELVTIQGVDLNSANIAGVEVPVLEKIKYDSTGYDLMVYPLWIDAGISKLKGISAADIELAILKKQAELLEAELVTTTQRVNLFEKVRIPATKENIRVINIFLGDQQTAAVVRGKMSKRKLVRGTA